MPSYRSWFPSKWVCAEDLRDHVVPVTIERITTEEMPNDGEHKPVLYFRGMQKGLVLNKTNAKRIAQMYGSDTDEWLGKEVLLYPSETDLRGETVPCIRIKLVEHPAQLQVTPGQKAPQADDTAVVQQSQEPPSTPRF